MSISYLKNFSRKLSFFFSCQILHLSRVKHGFKLLHGEYMLFTAELAKDFDLASFIYHVFELFRSHAGNGFCHAFPAAIAAVTHRHFTDYVPVYSGIPGSARSWGAALHRRERHSCLQCAGILAGRRLRRSGFL